MALTRRDNRTRQVISRLSVLDGYNSVSSADPIETAKRLERLRYGTPGGQSSGVGVGGRLRAS